MITAHQISFLIKNVTSNQELCPRIAVVHADELHVWMQPLLVACRALAVTGLVSAGSLQSDTHTLTV